MGNRFVTFGATDFDTFSIGGHATEWDACNGQLNPNGSATCTLLLQPDSFNFDDQGPFVEFFTSETYGKPYADKIMNPGERQRRCRVPGSWRREAGAIEPFDHLRAQTVGSVSTK